MRRASLFLLYVAIASVSFVRGASADPAPDAARWLASRLEPSGELPSYGGSGVGEIVVALLAGAETGDPVDRALRFIRTEGPRVAKSPAHAARIVMALVAAGADPRSPVDYVARIGDGYDTTTGAWEDNVYADALAALGLLAAGENLPGRAVTYLRAQQCPTGGFSWRAACVGPPDTDTTSMVMSALLASGLPSSDSTVERARTYLDSTQNDDGGFGLEAGTPTNANSTGLALSAIAALGEDPAAGDWRTPSGRVPVAALESLQHPSGGFRYLATDDAPQDYATVQALPGLRGIALPMPRVDRREPVPSQPPESTAPNGVAPGAGARVAAAGVEATPSARVNRAGVVVAIGDQQESFCVAFDEPEITGDELLRRTGLALDVSRSSVGTAVCSIDGTGCGAGDCFCRYPTFWGYWTLDGGAREWVLSERGAAGRTVTDGSIDAWVWGADGKPAPAATTLDEVCSGAAATARATPSTAADDAPRERDGSPVGIVVSFAAVAAVLATTGALVTLRRRRDHGR